MKSFTLILRLSSEIRFKKFSENDVSNGGGIFDLAKQNFESVDFSNFKMKSFSPVVENVENNNSIKNTFTGFIDRDNQNVDYEN